MAKRPIYAGKVLIDTVTPEARPQMASLRPNVLEVEKPGDRKKAEIEKVKVEAKSNDLRAVIKELIKTAGEKVDLTEASVIVSGGRGMKSGDNFKILEGLACAFGEGATEIGRAHV